MMNKNESAKCFNEQIRKRWPRWTPSDVEISDWLVWLEKYDYPTIATAARTHLAESRYAKPIPSQLLDHAKKLAPKPTPKQKTQSSGVPATHTFIMCTARDDDKTGRLGWFVDILICPLNRTYSDATYRRVAAEQARRHSETYGGTWEVFTHTNQSEMLKRSNQLTDTQPLDLTQLRKRVKTK
ncbi:MAG: hypothetical protein ACYSO1_09325 [Planctomycetota bacterium]|jgi:hypothetical protein